MPAALLLLLAACAPSDRPLLSEIFYDAIGSDSGHEFVELFNPTSAGWSLEGVTLEAGNGSEAGDWTLRWTGSAGDSVPPSARFVIGGAQVEPLPHAVVSLALQNGPDAVRLTWPDGAAEVVGYGAHEFDEYFCVAPAPDVAAGQSLARVPDDARGGANAADFRAAAPSPGRANQPARDAAWAAGSLVLDPEQPALGAGARLSGTIVNRGREDIEAGALALAVRAREAGADVEVARTALDRSLAPGDSAGVALEIVGLAAGKHTLVATLELLGDGAPENDRDSLRVRVGPGPLEVTEIQFHPRAGEGEWIEVRNRGDSEIDLSAFTYSDRGKALGRIGVAATCAPGSLAVLAQQPEALLARYPALDPTRVWAVSPWSALNNSDDANGIADAVVVRELDGTRVARVDFSAAGVPAGVPIEEREGFWWPALDPAGSPLSAPRRALALGTPFVIGPRRVPHGDASVRLSWSLPWSRARAAIDLYDMAGGWVGRLRPETTVPARGEIEQPLGGLAAGLYLVVLRAREDRGDASLVATQVLRVSGASP